MRKLEFILLDIVRVINTRSGHDALLLVEAELSKLCGEKLSDEQEATLRDFYGEKAGEK